MSNIDLEKLTDEQIAQIKAILTADNTNTASVKANNKNADDNNNDKSLEELFERDAKGNIRQSNYNCQLVLSLQERYVTTSSATRLIFAVLWDGNAMVQPTATMISIIS